MMNVLITLLVSLSPANADMSNRVDEMKLSELNHACIVRVNRNMESGKIQVYCNSEPNSYEVQENDSTLVFSSVRIENSNGNATDDIQTIRAEVQDRFTRIEGYRGRCLPVMTDSFESQLPQNVMARQMRGTQGNGSFIRAVDTPAITHQDCKFVR